MFNLTDHINNLKSLNRSPVLKALEDKIIILPDSPDQRTKGGLIIPASAQEKTTTGLVIAIGGKTLDGKEMQVRVGDKVLYSKFAGTPVTIDGQEMQCIRHSDLSLICERSPLVKKVTEKKIKVDYASNGDAQFDDD